MEVTTARPANEATTLAAASVQSSERFNERRVKENDSQVDANKVIFFSPVVKIDKDTQSAVLQYRDSSTGEVKNEYPSEKQLKSYESAQELEQPEVQVVVLPKPEAKAEVKAEVKEPVKAEVKEPVKVEAKAPAKAEETVDETV